MCDETGTRRVDRDVSALVPSSGETDSQRDAGSGLRAKPEAGPVRPDRLDDAALDALFRACVADVHAYAISLLGDRAAAEDVTALAFERLYRSRSRLDRGRGTPRAWLFAIARNAALDELRRRQRQPACELPEELSVERHAAEALEEIARRTTVREALRALPLHEREVVLLKFHGQLSNSELARALGISESNAGTRLHRALTHLREHCDGLKEAEVA
jgi:RNA polymerase sigma factor (sigma-70 family)